MTKAEAMTTIMAIKGGVKLTPSPDDGGGVESFETKAASGAGEGARTAADMIVSDGEGPV